MKIFIPYDYEDINLHIEENPNRFGEGLRRYCFVGNCEDLGCYSTFELIPQMKKVTSGKYFEEAVKELFEDIEPHVYVYEIKEKDCYIKDENMHGEIIDRKICDPSLIVCGWTWDGDGCLYVRYNNKAAVNTDCKCDYTWEWVSK